VYAVTAPLAWTRTWADSHPPPCRPKPPGPTIRVAADLRVGAEPDAAVDALLPQSLGLLAHLRRVDVREELVERLLVVTGVVGDADRRLVRLAERRDEVLAPYLHGVHPELGRELVHRDLDQVGRLGPARSTDRVRGELVRHHVDDVGLHGRGLVDAAHDEPAQRRDHRREQHLVGADVGDDRRVERGDRAVALGAHPDLVDLVAPVMGDHHALGARLDPLDRAIELA
jgi:hypothetical protein